MSAPTAGTDRLLEKYRLVFSGKFPGYSHKELHTLVTSLGATVTQSVSGRNTHLVCDERDYLKNASKVANAAAVGVATVKFEWIERVVTLKTKLDPDDFLWPSKEHGATSPQKATAIGTKRPASACSSRGDTINDGGSQGFDHQALPKRPKAEPSDMKVDMEVDSQGGQQSIEDESIEKKLQGLNKGQFMKTKDLIIPVDEHCLLIGYSVYVEPLSGMIYDAALNQSNASNNHNKYYRLQILVKGTDYKTWTRWGRVGERGHHTILGEGSLDDAKKHFEKKFKEKSGLFWKDRTQNPKPNKYAFVERSYEDESDNGGDDPSADNTDKAVYRPPECTLAKPVQEVMKLIFNQNFFNATMVSLNYDADKLPLGKLSKATILRGFQQLRDLAALIDNPTLADSQWNMDVQRALEHLSNLYYSLIPHAFGRSRPPVVSSEGLLRREIELLESLSDMKDAASIMKVDRSRASILHPLDSHYLGLGMEEMTPLEHTTSEFSLLKAYLNGSKGSSHAIEYTVHNIFRIRRGREFERFDQSKFASIPSDRRLLWHGSRCTNFGGILSQGLRIAPPEAPVSGYMFGKGIYLADMSTKSANYCYSHNSTGQALLLLCEAELGNPLQKLTDASYNAGDDAKSKGMYSTWGMGGTGPSRWMDAGTVHESLQGIKMPDTETTPGPTNVDGAYLAYNEYICYDVAQVKLRYLFHVEMGMNRHW